MPWFYFFYAVAVMLQYVSFKNIVEVAFIHARHREMLLAIGNLAIGFDVFS